MIWDIAIGLIVELIWSTVENLHSRIKNNNATWRGNIEDLCQNGVYQNCVWEKPIIIDGTFSEYIPFVNFQYLLPFNTTSYKLNEIGTCRLGDTITPGKYVSAIYLPDERLGRNMALPIFYQGDSLLCSPSVRTGSQVRLECKISRLDNIWRKVLNPGELVYGPDTPPYGLEVIKAERQKNEHNEFWIDAWWLYHLNISPTRFDDDISGFCGIKAVKNIYKGRRSSLENIPLLDLILSMNTLMLHGMVDQKTNDKFGNVFTATYANPNDEKPGETDIDRTYYQIMGSIDINNQDSYDSYSKFSLVDSLYRILGPELFGLILDFELDGKIPKKYSSLSNMKTTLDFHYDQTNNCIEKSTDIKSIISLVKSIL